MLFKRILLVVLLLTGAQIQAATVSFNEQDFSTWSSSAVVGNNGAQTGSFVGAGGNPGSYWSVRTNTNDLTSTISAPSSSFVYDFSAGAISQIVFSIDYLLETSFGQGHRFGLYAVQDGNSFFSTGAITGSVPADFGNWISFSETIVASDFNLPASEVGTLDFSAGASEIAFGLRTANSGGNTIRIGYDNFNVELNTVSTVPLPAAAWLFGSALLGFGVFRRKSKLVS